MNEQKNILLVQLFSNGDCLYATAVARQIKNDFPGCRLTWAVEDFCKNIIAGNPYVDEILVTDKIAKNDAAAFRKYKRKVQRERKSGKWNEVFITTTMDTNLAYYDGTIRGMVFRAYQRPVSVPLQPSVVLSEEEKNNISVFANVNNLSSFEQVILWEYAPQSGQSELSFDLVMKVSKRITAGRSVCMILSSANKFESSAQIIDGSVLSVRENAGVTHHCSLLIGCSSGITWLTTSSAAKFLPMLQLLNANAEFINTPSVDFKRFNIRHSGLIEMKDFDEESICNCLEKILSSGFRSAEIYNQHIPLQFRTTKKIVYNLLVYREFASIRRHFMIMKSIYGMHPAMLAAFAAGIAGFPFKLVKNVFSKKIMKKKSAVYKK